jgi:predicted nucleic acid-binding protein
MTPDVNVPVAASRSDHPHHAVARAWLEEAVTDSGSGAAFTLMPMVLASLLKLVTSRNVFQSATAIDRRCRGLCRCVAGVAPACDWRDWVRSGRCCASSASTRN